MWRIEYRPEDQVLTLQLLDQVGPSQMRALAEAHARALEATGGERFRVFVDLRGLFPLEAEAVALLGEIKRIAAEQRGCLGFAILADSATVAMQQHRTRVRTGTDAAQELITLDEVEARRFLER